MQVASLVQPHIHREGGEQPVRRRRQSGFTLVELLAVVVILVILAGIGFVVVNNQIETSRQNTDVANVRTIADAVNRYIMDHPDLVAQGGHPTANDLTNGYLARFPQNPWNDGDYTITVNTNNRTVTIGSPHNNQHSVTLNY